MGFLSDSVHSMKKVVIIDYNLGNIFSVKHACQNAGIEVEISNSNRKLRSAHGLILPGVGAFRQAMKNIELLNLREAIVESVNNGKPLLGICLGMQLLFSESDEFGKTSGLELICGKVKRLKTTVEGENNSKVPNIGWRKLIKPSGIDWNNTVFKEINNGDYMYFVHSFYCEPAEKKNLLSTTLHGNNEYCSTITNHENIIATQFHPEKSGATGIRLLESWSQMFL